ncbi:hypothetical protein ACC754_42955, partial [Rhizobium johnstonii]
MTHLAPVHLPPALAIVHSVWSAYPYIPQTVSFDTAFHSSQSPWNGKPYGKTALR